MKDGYPGFQIPHGHEAGDRPGRRRLRDFGKRAHNPDKLTGDKFPASPRKAVSEVSNTGRTRISCPRGRLLLFLLLGNILGADHSLLNQGANFSDFRLDRKHVLFQIRIEDLLQQSIIQFRPKLPQGATGWIGEGHIALPEGVHQTRDTEERILPKDFRIQKIVIDSPINDVDLRQALGSLYVHTVLENDNVGTLNDFDAHLAREEGVFEIGRIVHPRCQEHYIRIRSLIRGQVHQHVQ